jgi:hypothetical protein
MATKQDVKRYLAYWFQLGKKVVINNGAASLLPKVMIVGDRYSDEFEECWQTILSSGAEGCHLEGTHETIAELLTLAWDMLPCGRCSMPVPVRNMGMPPLACPCNDLPTWPNTELPAPRSPVHNQDQLIVIRDRLLNLTSTNN